MWLYLIYQIILHMSRLELRVSLFRVTSVISTVPLVSHFLALTVSAYLVTHTHTQTCVQWFPII